MAVWHITLTKLETLAEHERHTHIHLSMLICQKKPGLWSEEPSWFVLRQSLGKDSHETSVVCILYHEWKVWR